MQCAVQGIPLPEIEWFHDGQKVFTRPQSQGNIHEILNNGTILKISNTRLGQEGRYACIATNRVGKAEADIFVQVVGEFLISLQC